MIGIATFLYPDRLDMNRTYHNGARFSDYQTDNCYVTVGTVYKIKSIDEDTIVIVNNEDDNYRLPKDCFDDIFILEGTHTSYPNTRLTLGDRVIRLEASNRGMEPWDIGTVREFRDINAGRSVGLREYEGYHLLGNLRKVICLSSTAGITRNSHMPGWF